MDTKTPPKPRRTLTEEQLGKKRRIDKLKHRENRAENKTRLENIERDVSFLRDTIGDLMLQLRQLNHGGGALEQSPTTSRDGSQHHHHQHHQDNQHQHHQHQHHQHHHHHQHQNHHPHQQLHQHALSNQLVCMPKTEPWASPPDDAPSSLTTVTTTTAPGMTHVAAAFYDPTADPITQRLYAQHIFPQQPLEAQVDMDALLAEIRGHDQSAVECRCGKPHSADVQCTERIAVIMAVEFSNVSNQTSLRASTAARNPSLTDMLLHHTDMSNPLAAILSTILRQYDVNHVDSMCGIFFLTYRLLRWRYYPSAESLADVPTIMRPTQAQITIPHPKCIDFLPFPALRNHLCLNQHIDARHSVDLYLQSLRLNLPPGKGFMSKTERGSVDLHPEFEMLASDLRNWDLGAPWSDHFPHLRQFLY